MNATKPDTKTTTVSSRTTRRSADPHYRLLSAALAALALVVITANAPACDIEVQSGSTTLSIPGGHEVDCIFVAEGATLNLNGGIWITTDPNGLTCDGTININSGAGLELTGGGTSTVDGTLNVNNVGSLGVSSAGTLSVDGTLNVNAGGQLGISNATVTINGSLSVGGVIKINAGGTLILAGGGSTTVGGTIKLKSATSVIRITVSDQTLMGSGKIVGEYGSAKIEIADGKTLTSQITIEGVLQIVGMPGSNTTRFINDTGGLVHANRAGALDLNVDALDDGANCAAGDWQVSSANAVILKFSVGSILLSGDFTVNVSHASGKLWIRANVATEGDLTFTDGKIQVGSGCYFKANWDCGCL